MFSRELFQYLWIYKNMSSCSDTLTHSMKSVLFHCFLFPHCCSFANQNNQISSFIHRKNVARIAKETWAPLQAHVFLQLCLNIITLRTPKVLGQWFSWNKYGQGNLHSRIKSCCSIEKAKDAIKKIKINLFYEVQSLNSTESTCACKLKTQQSDIYKRIDHNL